MANTYKNIVITPNRDTTANVVPNIRFAGGDVNTNTDISLYVYTTSNGTLSFEGSSGQLFSITNDLTGTIFSVNDISGIPSIEVDASGLINLAEFGGNIAVGKANANYKLDVQGTINASNVLINGSPISIDYSPAFNQANLALAGANVANITADAAFDAGNVIHVRTNVAFNTANIAFNQANLALAGANAANITADAAFNAVNVAYASSNTKFSSSGGTITGDVSIVGTLTLSGNTQLQNVTTLTIGDPLIYLAANNYVTDTVDIGFIANYVNATGQNVHTGLYREHETKQWYLFQGYDKEPINNHLGALSNNMTLAVLNAELNSSNIWFEGLNLSSRLLTIHTTSNVGFTQANLALSRANTANITADAAFNQANLALSRANTANITADVAFGQANLALSRANTANITADSAFNAGNNIHARTNIAFNTANVSFLQSNLAFAQANLALSRANTANITADAAFNQANAAYTKANTSSGGSYYQGNNGDVGSVAGLGDIFRVHSNTLTQNVTIYSGNNAVATGPLTIETGKVLTVQNGARVSIV